MNDLANLMRRECLRVLNGKISIRTGIVSDYDPVLHAALVRVGADMDANDYWETGWIPIVTPWVGASWGLFAPVAPGDQVVCAFDDADRSLGAVLGGIFSEEQPAVDVPSEEFHLIHKSGSALKFKADGHVDMIVKGDLAMTVDGDITSSANQWDHTGPINVSGDVTVSGTVEGSTVKQGSVILGSHVHSGVTSGGSSTGGPI